MFRRHRKSMAATVFEGWQSQHGTDFFVGHVSLGVPSGVMEKQTSEEDTDEAQEISKKLNYLLIRAVYIPSISPSLRHHFDFDLENSICVLSLVLDEQKCQFHFHLRRQLQTKNRSCLNRDGKRRNWKARRSEPRRNCLGFHDIPNVWRPPNASA